ncbi:response regulator [uncultured Caulobacter sp.]|uniref:response regulator n=1 Tax=uncultured Caulobacter sp. TaxID=158749 RepID=UPI002619859B|nr:response regulator [uncultured Caulobacter sp.]
MPSYQFHLRLDDASRPTVTVARLADDNAALRRAEALLVSQPRALDVIVCQGERYVGARDRNDVANGSPRATILVVEDCFLQANTLKVALEDAGYAVRCRGHEDQALSELDRARPTLALIDINLGDGPSYAVAATLERLGVPFVFVTGYDRRVLPPRWRGAQYLSKPVTGGQVVDAVRGLLQRRGGTAPAPEPRKTSA